MPDLEGVSSADLLDGLEPGRRKAVLDYIDWLLRVAPGLTSVEVVEGMCTRLVELGVPLDRYRSSLTINTADADAYGRTWLRGQGVGIASYVRSADIDADYLRSPFHEAGQTKRWVELWLPTTPDDRFGIVPELKADGYTHYICSPLRTTTEFQGWVTLATKAADGFSRADRRVLALVIPVLSALINTRVARLTLDLLLRTYVGDEPHRAILDGHVKRGQVSTIRSAILFADMRDSTGHTAEISAVEAVALFNDFFDCLVPPIERRGGEVLKYTGDGLLGIFRDGSDDQRDAAAHALAAAEEALANLAAYNQGRPGHRPIELGIALHYGEAAYGNVGSGLRLDFTVIGRDVSLAARIGSLNGRLGEPILMSSTFVAKLDAGVEPVGTFALRGFTTPMTLFRPLQGSVL